jgi:acetylornithine deacetylase/succinyl-diaminopimelate desuccinylase-like protein
MKTLMAALSLLISLTALAEDQSLFDWDEVARESSSHLTALIQINSSNPPGNETEVANYLKRILATEGIASELYALEPDRANLVARINGNGSKRPLLIMGHTDVVGVQAEQWTEDPFAGVIKDGFIYGRGALDDKDNVTAGLIVMLMLKRYQIALDRDVIFLAESGEEGTPRVGINYMVAEHWDKIDAEYALAEGGANMEIDGQVSSVGIETTEKLPRRATLVARGTAGHGSIPRVDNAVTILAQAVARAGLWKTPVRLNDTTRAYFDRLAQMSDEEDAWRFNHVGDPEQIDDIQQYFLINDPYHYSVLRTSVVPTVLDGGFRKNVIPSEASAILDIRMLPDEDVAGFYAELAKIIDDPRVEIVPEDIYRPAAPPSKIDNEMFQALEAVSRKMYPDATVLPIMQTGATDMAQVRAKGVQAYGIGPTRTLEEMNSKRGAHGDDERISEQALLGLVQFLRYTVLEVAATP